MSQLLESTASSEPTAPGTSDPRPSDGADTTPATMPDEPSATPADLVEDLQKRQHPFGD